jgi:hypothetical protein
VNIETRVANLEKIHPPGQNIYITSLPTETVEESIKIYESEHNIKFNHDDPTNKIWDIKFF